MIRTHLTRGLIAGLFAGVVAMGFAYVVGEPPLRDAIALEDAKAARATPAAGAHAENASPVGRTAQSTIGLGTGTIVAGAALGGLFALVFAFVQGRFSRARARVTSAAIAAVAFVAVFLVPFLKYPGNPPGIGNPDTIGHRSNLYFLLLLLSLLSAVVAAIVGRWSSARAGAWNGALIGAATFAVLIVLTYVLMPAVDEVVTGYPASLVWRFRLASIGIQAVLWGAIGIGFGALTERSERQTTPSLATALAG